MLASGVYRDAPGWTDNVATGTEDVNSSTIKGGRLALRFTPNESLTVDLSGIVQDIENDGYAFQDNIAFTLTPQYGRNKWTGTTFTGRHWSDLSEAERARTEAGTVLLLRKHGWNIAGNHNMGSQAATIVLQTMLDA